jgi:hypothetical protein
MTRPAGTYAIFETSQGNIVIKLLDKEAPRQLKILSAWPKAPRNSLTKKPARKKNALTMTDSFSTASFPIS